LLQQIDLTRPPGSVIVEEAPSSRGPMQAYLPIIMRDTFYTCASGGLGHGLPAAIGVALGRPKEKVIAILGDGSSMYAIQGLWTAAQLSLPITFIVINNHRYQALVDFGRHFGLERTIGTDLHAIDFCALARGQGCSAVRIDHPEMLTGALQSAFLSPTPTLVEVVVA
jgi:benzoylformate decarboxylase